MVSLDSLERIDAMEIVGAIVREKRWNVGWVQRTQKFSTRFYPFFLHAVPPRSFPRFRKAEKRFRASPRLNV